MERMLRQDEIVAQGHRSFERMAQFPHVAWPCVLAQQTQCVVGQLGDRPPHLLCDVSKIGFCDDWNIAGSIAQRREPEDESLQSEIQIFTEPALGHTSLEIAIGCGHDPDVHGGRDRRSDAIERLLLEDAQEFALVI